MEAKTSPSCKRAAKNAPFCFRVTALSQFARLFLEPQKYGSTCLTTVLHCFSHGFSYLFTLIQFIYSFIVDLRFYANLSNPPPLYILSRVFHSLFQSIFIHFAPLEWKTNLLFFHFSVTKWLVFTQLMSTLIPFDWENSQIVLYFRP